MADVLVKVREMVQARLDKIHVEEQRLQRALAELGGGVKGGRGKRKVRATGKAGAPVGSKRAPRAVKGSRKYVPR